MFFTYMRTRPQAAAIGYMLISSAGFSLMSVGVRLVAPELSAPVIIMLRNALTLVLLLPLILYQGSALIRTTRLKDHLWRSMLGTIGMMSWTYSLTIIPLGHATALSFTAPLISTLFAVMFLGEKAGITRWLALLVGFGGTLIILNPNPHDFAWIDLLVIFATTAWAITGLFIKSLSSTEPPLRMVFYMNFFMLLAVTPFGIAHWQMPSAHAWLVLFFIAGASIIMHFSMAKAFSLARVVTLVPFDFTRLIYTSILAYFIFNETSPLRIWIGAAIIIASAAFMAHRDAKAASVVE
jgi:drug/metabolite transporter (DMT)-like permease